MDAKKALEYIHGTLRFGSKPGLETIGLLADKLGNPQNDLKFIHVAGTNGKGSTCAYIASILQAQGYKTGLFISPYVDVFNERIQINRQYIKDEDLAWAVEKVKEKADEIIREGKRSPTEFELVTAAALLYFKKEQCDYVVWETGLGGRFDATNIVKTTLCAVITNIGYDHTAILGDTLPKIAFEKAGIIKEGIDVVLYDQTNEVKDVIRETCHERNANLSVAKFDDINVTESSIQGYEFDKGSLKGLRITLLGDHQLKNATVALEVCKCLIKQGIEISEESIREGLMKTRWQARAEVINVKPLIMVDGGHNPQCAEALRDLIQKHFPGIRPVYIYGSLKDKDYKSVCSILFPGAKEVITVTTIGERGLSAEELAKTVKIYCNQVIPHDTIKEAVAFCKKNSSEEDIVVCFGSLTFLAEIRKEIIDIYK
ncbi:MAG TPA: bifunctional folylpolyglutamate synthase/dihydrofolate synthase [Clostridiales bacterium]|nr:bifunctional folylpolyglutamate synthase/dihydrofolate synthase [Clostridiales bacterium]